MVIQLCMLYSNIPVVIFKKAKSKKLKKFDLSKNEYIFDKCKNDFLIFLLYIDDVVIIVFGYCIYLHYNLINPLLMIYTLFFI